MSKYVFLATRATGRTPTVDDIVWISAIVADVNGVPVDRFDKAIILRERSPDPSSDVAARCGYNKEKWQREAVSFDRFVEFVRGRGFDGANQASVVGISPYVDLALMQLGYAGPARQLLPFSRRILDLELIADLLRWAGVVSGKSNRIEDITKELGIDMVQPTTPMGECEAMVSVWKALRDVMTPTATTTSTGGKK